MEREGLITEGWTFGFNKRKIHLGYCWYSMKKISLSLHFVTHNEAEQVREIILHEIAHALTNHDKGHHGPLWAAECKRLGIPATIQYSCVMPSGKWTASCKECGKGYTRHYKPTKRRTYYCAKCDNSKLKWTYNG